MPPQRAIAAGLPLAGVAIGAAAISLGIGFGDPRLWLPDLATGVAFFVLAAAAAAVGRHRRLALLAAVTGVLWFAGSIWEVAAFWHRGPLVHLYLTYPEARTPRSVFTRSAIVAAYLASVAPVIWGTDAAAVALAVAVMAFAARRWATSHGPARRSSVHALVATGLFAASVVAGAVARLVVNPAAAALPLLLLYEAALLIGVGVLTAGLTSPRTAAVTDIVVDLAAGSHRESSRSALARAVGDSSLIVGYRGAGADVFVDDAGTPLDLTAVGADRRTTVVDRHDGTAVVLVHRPGVLDDPRLRTAVAHAARLGSENARLQSRVRAAVAEAEASRRRLISAADDERARLGEEIATTVGVPLRDLSRAIADSALTSSAPQLTRAHRLLDEVGARIDEAVMGLEPPGLESGLTVALRTLAERSAVQVSIHGEVRRSAPDIERAAYYVCAEAITNTAKHAPGAAVRIRLLDEPDRLVFVIDDDGPGGADPSRGSGLTGVADRVNAVGGQLTVAGATGDGTTVTATFPAMLSAPATVPSRPTADRIATARGTRPPTSAD